MSETPQHSEYRCPDGHVFWNEGKLVPSPETLPCPHMTEGSQDACRKEGKRFDGRRS